MALMKAVFVLMMLLLNAGCTYLFYHPDQVDYSKAARTKLNVEEGFFPSGDGTKLSYWHLKTKSSKKPDGLVVQFHGNAQNMTSHFASLSWLLSENYDLFTFDYRGYGQSQGSPTPRGTYEDGIAAIEFASQKARALGVPLILYGQSLGGSILLKVLEDKKPSVEPILVVIESSFYSYTGVARKKLASVWLTWPFQWLPFLLISNGYSPEGDDLGKISPVPTLLLYSRADPIIPYSDGEQIFAKLKDPKYFWTYEEAGHIAGMFVQNGKYRLELLNLLETLKAKNTKRN